MMVLDEACKLSDDVDVRFAALVHDLGKATTDAKHLPAHPGHEQRSKTLIRRLAERLPVPRSCRDLGLIVAEFHTHCHRAFDMKDATILKVLERADAFRRPDRFEKFLLACEADARGRTGLEDRDYPQADLFRTAFRAAAAVDGGAIAANTDETKIAAAIRRARASAIGKARKTSAA